jgi:hypothetical protein
MARLPFDRYLARIVGDTPAVYVVEAMELLWGEESMRALVKARKSYRVRNLYLIVRRAFRRCDEVVGEELYIDDGETTEGPFGVGHVYIVGIVTHADVVIVENNRGRRSIAFEIKTVRGKARRGGKFAPRIRDTFLVQSLPRGQRVSGS